MNRKIVLTADGSASVFSEEVNENYHSHFGAIQESKHIFINAGLCSETIALLDNISILEIGFGTGLNALLTFIKAEELHKKIYYETLELYPLAQEEVNQLNYPDLLPYYNVKEVFTKLHRTCWDIRCEISDNFTLVKRQVSAIQASYSTNAFDLVYFDAFSPEAQPEMWTKEIFEPIYNSMKNDGILLTYCTKGIVKRTLREIGFEIEKMEGPMGKREILRGMKVMKNLSF